MSVTLRKYLLACQAKLEAIKVGLLEQNRPNEDVSITKLIVENVLLCKCNEVHEEESPQESFIKVFLHLIESKTNRSYRESLNHTLSRIRLYDKDIDHREFEELNVRWLYEFDDSLARKGSSQNTRAIHFRNKIYLASLDTSVVDKANSLILSSL